MQDIALLKRLKALIIFRIFFVTFIVGTFFVFNIGYQNLLAPNDVLYLIIFLYVLSFVYAVLLRMLRNLLVFAYIQITVDALASICLILFTGGIGSWFSSSMLLTVIASVIIVDRRAGYFIATVCSILYGYMLDLQFYRIIPLGYDAAVSERDFLFNIFTHISALYLTAYLTGHLSLRLEKTSRRLEEKDSDLRDLSVFNKELIESLPTGFLTTDVNGRIMIFNRAAEGITGISSATAIGLEVADVFPFISNLPETSIIEGRVQCSSDEKILGMVISGITNSAGQKAGYLCIFQDITEFKNLEAELKHRETLAAIGELSANMAHEIRNPLASLKGSIEMLKEGSLDGAYKERLMNIALSEMDRLNKIITDFLFYSRPPRPEFSAVDLHDVLDGTIDLIKNACVDNKDISITKDFAGRCDIVADPQKLRQVFLNLGMNAIESMPEGGELKIGTRTDKKTASIFFKDTGLGIKPGDLNNIFYPFYTTKEKGTGLGLSIAYRIIEEHGGNIKVQSSPAEGTTFEVWLPVRHESRPDAGGVIRKRYTADKR